MKKDYINLPFYLPYNCDASRYRRQIDECLRMFKKIKELGDYYRANQYMIKADKLAGRLLWDCTRDGRDILASVRGM